ncbi:glucosaminidase domain-containing protein [Halarcobacter bivalviorum]|uniref:FlgJ-related protein (Bax domain) n=1 Tax=Halarcobacter bivalviorum TaxID=663364 RepID=A0AAX2A9S6_9BACT|nr:glucosaminidase domain-containing protein [Halarcobacter bivalviorum]AXH11174.1 putative FlgJ-related protein (Bax domain) [Halarcobacter bivalviorum]RXK09446.1 mannosyl-glycoprotein endo-beta-N-acetylglucosamidase [Halarcobacter bivalviorum]
MKLLKILFLVLTICSFALANSSNKGFSQEYYKLQGKKAKDYFFNFLGKKVEIENLKILKERDFILSLDGKKDLNKDSKEYKELEKLQKKYKVKNIYDYKTFLNRVDIIPPSLAIAQAATESAWGKSRFIREANNIFGHWTYDKKIGMVPLRREEGKKHMVRIFPNLESSIAVYMRNLNRTGAYKSFRDNREKMRKNGKFINGLILSEDMTKYSAIGYDYVIILKSIIKKYKLTQLDKKFYEKQITK